MVRGIKVLGLPLQEKGLREHKEERDLSSLHSRKQESA